MGKIYCSKCGTQIEDTASFCYKCGTPVTVMEESKMDTATSTSGKKLRNPFTKWIFITIAVQIGLIILSARPGDLGGFAFGSALALTLVVLSLGIITILKSKNYNNTGKSTGIVFTILSSIIILIVVLAILFAGGDNNTNDNDDGNSATQSTSDISTSQPEEDKKTPTVTPTNWDTFECNYYGDIPVGLLDTPDATSDIVTKYINEKIGRTDTYEVKQVYNAYHANLIEIENLFTIYNCKGTARFYFDWAETLYKIEFEFSEDGGITPAIMSKIHDDIDNIVGGKCATNYLIDKGASNPHDEFTNNGMCTCGWHLQEDLNCTARMTSYFNNRPIECTFEFERNKYTNKTNYNVSGNIGAGSDSITVSGVTIKGTYHGASSPYVSGTATNNSSKTVEFIKIKIALKDSSGKVTNTVWTYAVGAEGLAPGETTQWTVYCTKAEDIEITIFN